MNSAIRSHGFVLSGKGRLLLAVGIAALGMTGTSVLHAQDQQADSSIEEISVTGTRLRRSGFDTPNPVTVISNEQIENLGLVNVAEVMDQIPQNQPYVTPTNIGLGNFNVGASLANLRGLNPYYGTRTLTLVDGRRHVPSTNGGAVDLNLIPSPLIQRAETVTGGASAAYGTDAVAGVVNIILDTDFQGFRAQVDYGQTTEGDAEDYHAAFAGGFDFSDGRGHVVIGGEYQDTGEIGDCAEARDWCAESWDDITNPGYNNPDSPYYGEPNFIIAPDSRSGYQTFTGVFPGLNRQFNDEGTALVDYDPGRYASPNNFLPFQGHAGGDGPSVYSSLKLRVPVERYALMGHVDFALNENINTFAELSYGERSSVNVGWAFGPGIQFISPDNAFLPEAVAAQLQGPTRFNRSLVDEIRQTNYTDNETWRLAFGADGSFNSNWTWDAYYQYGDNDQSQRLHNNKVNSFFNYAIDAVIDPASGEPACRARVADAGINPYFAENGTVDPGAQGCVPINLFGRDNITQAAIDYTHRTLMEDFTYEQHVVAGNVQGTVSEGWGAGTIDLATGIEYRNDSGDVTHGDQPFYDQFALSYEQDFAGEQETLEGYAELNVPVLSDMALAESLVFNGAVRQTRTESTNDLTGNSTTRDITTWKLSGTWDLTEWLRLRGTQSRDIRAAGFRELYITQAENPGTGLGGSVINRWTDDPADVTRSLGGGNVDLDPEEADTITLGAILQPTGTLDGLRASLDWYEIELDDAINSNVGNQAIVDLCWEFGQFCERIEGTADGSGGYSDITFIDNRAANYAQIAVRGADLGLNYSLDLNRINTGWGGALDVNFMGAYLYDFIVDTGASSRDFAGQSGPLDSFTDYNPAPYWILNGWATYSNGPVSLTLRTRYIDEAAYRKDRIGPDKSGYDPTLPNSINDNTVSSRLYVNLSGSYAFRTDRLGSLEVFGSIDNLLDRDPPVAPGGNGGATNPVYFNVTGTTIRGGVRVRF